MTRVRANRQRPARTEQLRCLIGLLVIALVATCMAAQPAGASTEVEYLMVNVDTTQNSTRTVLRPTLAQTFTVDRNGELTRLELQLRISRRQPQVTRTGALAAAPGPRSRRRLAHDAWVKEDHHDGSLTRVEGCDSHTGDAYLDQMSGPPPHPRRDLPMSPT